MNARPADRKLLLADPPAPRDAPRHARTARVLELLAAFGGVVVLSASVSGCHGRSEAKVDAAPPPSFASTVRQASPRAVDPMWALAQDGGDPLDLEELATREGAAGLVEGVEEGGVIARTALLAIPYAEDAELTLGRLGQIAAAVDDPEASLVLEAVYAVASRPLAQRESLDTEGVRSCAASMSSIASRRNATPRVRALAISVLRLFADRGWVASTLAPAD